MTGNDEIHNEISGTVGKSAFQIGAVQGDFVLYHHPPVQQSVEEPQSVRDVGDWVRFLSEQEVEHWGIHKSDALAVRWHAAAEDLFDHWEKIQDSPGRLNPTSLSGHFTAIRKTYQAIDSRRLVILGRAGAGKTVLAHRLILDVLNARHHSGQVPVLFSLSEWNPTLSSLRNWLTRQLVRDFPFLDKRDANGKKEAEIVVDDGWILPVLDGFDEIPEKYRSKAIDLISKADSPVIVTSRPAEYATAARKVKAVGRAAAIELDDLDLEETERYLRLSTGKIRVPEWHAVFAHLRAEPDETASRNLIELLKTPLMVTLARAIYSDADHDPRELLKTERFPGREHLEEHLLGAYLDAVYDPIKRNREPTRAAAWDPQRARHWLGYVATHLTKRNTHDLAWWHLPSTLHGRTRILLTTTMAGLTLWLFWLKDGIGQALGVGLLRGVVLGLMFGLVNEVVFYRRGKGREPERLRISLRHQGYATKLSLGTFLKRTAFAFLTGLATGLGVAVAVGIGAGLEMGMERGISEGLRFALWSVRDMIILVGLMLGLANVLLSALGDAQDAREAVKPWKLLTTDRRVTLVRTIASALVLGLGVTIVGAFQYGIEEFIPFGKQIGLGYALIGGVAGLMLSAWGSWLLFARLWLPLTGRMPWSPKRFLEDAYDRGVLRQTGAVYQFRHAQLRDHLANRYLMKPNSR